MGAGDHVVLPGGVVETGAVLRTLQGGDPVSLEKYLKYQVISLLLSIVTLKSKLGFY